MSVAEVTATPEEAALLRHPWGANSALVVHEPSGDRDGSGRALRDAGNLPEDLTSMVGRRGESSAVRRLLSGARLVTLTGPAGVGKSRLAVHVARQTQKAFPDGAWLVQLAELNAPDLLPLTIFAALTPVLPPGVGITELADHIGERSLLLVLDNCEHLAEACAKVTFELLRCCANLRVLATSREPLRFEGEAVFTTPPLSLPEPGLPVPPGAISRYDAATLFVDRASTVVPGLSLDAEDEQAVVELCQQLDGLPLAIELAAARTRVLSVRELLARQDERFQILTGGGRGGAARHQTLRAAVDHSYELCSARARLLWARLSVCVGGAGLGTLEAVCAAHDLPARELLDTTQELVHKSILSFDGTRYHMLETLRQYGRERLREQHAERATRLAHRDHFAALAAEVEAGWFGPDQPALLARVRAGLANIRAALQFCLTEPGQQRVGLSMAANLWNAWLGCGLQVEGRLWLDRFLAANPDPTSDRAHALWVAAYLAAVAGDTSEAVTLVEECLARTSQLDDPTNTARALSTRSLCHMLAGRIEDAVLELEEAVRLERAVPGVNPYLAVALLHLGVALCQPDHLDEARAALSESRELCAAHGEQLWLAWSLIFLGLADLFDNHVPQAVALLNEGLTRKHALNDQLGMSFATEFLAWAALAEGDAKRAARLMGASHTLAEPLGAHLAGFSHLLDWHDHHAQQARTILGPRAFDKALEHGRQLSRDEAVAYALGKTSTPAQTTVDRGDDVPLTPRERQIAELVATGKTNKEIAANLVVATRTVDSHVQNVLRKLGFTCRAQIATLIASIPATTTS